MLKEENSKEDYRLAAIMFTDIVGFSRMMERDENKTLSVLKEHNRIIQNIVKECGGNVIKTIGDAFLIDFKNTVNSVKCGLKIQEELNKFNDGKAFDDKLYIRIGIHLGDIWFFENDALGDGINIASRLQSLSEPGKLCISSDVHNQILNKIDVDMISLGRVKLKNISKEIYAYEISSAASEDFAIENRKIHEKIKDSVLNTDKYNNIKDTIGLDENISDSEKSDLNDAEAFEKESAKAEQKHRGDEEIKSSILTNLKVADARISLSGIQKLFNIPDEKIAKILSKLTNSGLLTKIEKDNGDVEYGMGSFRGLINKNPDFAKHSKDFEDFKNLGKEFIHNKAKSGVKNFTERSKKSIPQRIEEIIKKLDKSIKSFAPSFIVIPLVSYLLYFINMKTSPQILWFVIPSFFMIISVFDNFFQFVSSIFQKNVISNLDDDMSSEQFRVLRKYINSNKGLLGNISSFLNLNSMLLILNMFVNPSLFPKTANTEIFQTIYEYKFVQAALTFPPLKFLSSLNFLWFLIPAGIWGFFLIGHFIGHIARSKSLLKKIKSLEGVKPDSVKNSDNEDREVEKESGASSQNIFGRDKEIADLLIEARRIKDKILKKIGSSEALKEKFGDDADRLFEKHLVELEKIIERYNQVCESADSFSVENIDMRLKELNDKLEKTSDERLIEEYKKSIEQTIAHKNSYIELVNLKESLYLKFTSAVMSLKQLEMDVLKMKETIYDETETSIKMFEERSEDLAKYVKNLRKSYEEIERTLKN